MKRTVWTTLAALGFLLAACSTGGTGHEAPSAGDPAAVKPLAITAEHVTSQIVVGYDDAAALDRLITELGGGSVKKKIEFDQNGVEFHAALIELPSTLDAAHALGKLRGARVPGIQYAQPNFTHPYPEPVPASDLAPLGFADDPLEAQKWDHQVMQAADAWATDVDGMGTKPDGSGVVVGIVDTGIDGTHPDLAGAFVNGYDAVGCSTFGVIPPGIDASEGQIHGTHVAGIVAARGANGQGVAGVAPNATLMDLQVFCGGSTDDFTIASAIFAAMTDVDGDTIVPSVYNLSLGGKGYGQVLKGIMDLAMELQGAVFVVAMGNSEQDELQYPAGYPGIIAVGATNAQDEKASFSTSGAHISVSAPGVDILSTWPTHQIDPTTNAPYLYFRISGTSMATPQVTGAVALVKQFLPTASAYEVRRLLETTADDLGPAGFDPGTGWGRVNLKKLVDAVADVLAGNATTELGSTASVVVTTANLADTDADGVYGSAGDAPVPLEAVDVQLIQGGKVRYVAKTNGAGEALFSNVAPGDYQVMVAGQDITDFAGWAFWPHERVSWDADGDPANGVTPGSLTLNPGSSLFAPDQLAATLDSTLEVTLEWTGGGDLDLAVREYDVPTAGFVWSTAKTGALWGAFSGDDTGTDPASASETYTLNAVHYPTPASGYYHISIDASNATAGTTATLTITMNGVTKSYGPIPITPGTTAGDNDFDLLFTLVGFDNWPTVY